MVTGLDNAPINFSIGYNAKSQLLKLHGPKSDPDFSGM